jgi:hypothetical protein
MKLGRFRQSNIFEYYRGPLTSQRYPSDEPVCIATLLGLKLENFHPYPTMIDIYRSVVSIPQNILFVETPRLKIDGFRWAPATFLEQESVFFPLDLEPPQN